MKNRTSLGVTLRAARAFHFIVDGFALSPVERTMKVYMTFCSHVVFCSRLKTFIFLRAVQSASTFRAIPLCFINAKTRLLCSDWLSAQPSSCALIGRLRRGGVTGRHSEAFSLMLRFCSSFSAQWALILQHTGAEEHLCGTFLLSGPALPLFPLFV